MTNKEYNDIGDFSFKKCQLTNTRNVTDDNLFSRYINADLQDPDFINEALDTQNNYFTAKYAVIAAGCGGALFSIYKMIQLRHKVDSNLSDFIKYCGFFAATVGCIGGSFFLQSLIPGKIV